MSSVPAQVVLSPLTAPSISTYARLTDPRGAAPVPPVTVIPAHDPAVTVGPEKLTPWAALVATVCTVPPPTVRPPAPWARTMTEPSVASSLRVAPPGTLTPPAQMRYGLPSALHVVVPAGSDPQTEVPPAARTGERGPAASSHAAASTKTRENQRRTTQVDRSPPGVDSPRP